MANEAVAATGAQPPQQPPWFGRTRVLIAGAVVLAVAVALGQYLRDQRALADASTPWADDAAHGEAVTEAHDVLDGGDPSGAFDAYVAALAADGPDPTVLAHLGWTLAIAGDRDTAAELLAEAVRTGGDAETEWMLATVDGEGVPAPTDDRGGRRAHLESHAAQLGATITEPNGAGPPDLPWPP